MSTHPFRRALPAAALTAALGLTLAACGGSSGSPTAQPSTSAAEAAPVRGGNLTFAITVDSKCIDPQQVGNNDAIAIARQTVASLTAQDPDTGEIVPWIAQSWEVNDDATQFTFHLVDGATYADGTPIDAASVKTNFEAVVALGAKAVLGSTYLAGLQDVAAPDPSTVVVTFGAPSAQFLQASSTFSLGLLSPASAALSAEDRCAGRYVGSGPFVVESYTVDQQAVLARRDGYAWGPAGANDHTDEAYLDTVTFVVVPEAGVRTGSLASGQIDATAAISAVDLPQFDGNGFWIEYRANPGVVYNLFPNESRPLLADERVRLALLKGINREEVTSTVLGTLDHPATAALAHSTPFYEDLGDLLAYDPEGAKELLDEAGWVVGEDGIRVKDGQRLETTVTFWQPKEPLELVQQELRAIGFDLELNQLAIAEATAANASGDYDLSFGNLTRSDPDILRTLFSVNARNTNQRAAEEVDSLLDAQAAATDPASVRSSSRRPRPCSSSTPTRSPWSSCPPRSRRPSGCTA